MSAEELDQQERERKALIDEIVHGTFVSEGTMVALPLCFPGASVPIVADESHITALDVTPEGIVYGGTSGVQSHLFVGMVHGLTGAVFDLGVVPEASQCVAVCCSATDVLACVNGPAGGRVIRRRLESLPFDLIQEWGFGREPYQEVAAPVPGEPIVHAALDPAGRYLLVLTEAHLALVELEQGTCRLLATLPGFGQLAVGSQGGIYGLDQGAALWRFDPASAALQRQAVSLPRGSWQRAAFHWGRDPINGTLYLADDEGLLHAFTEERGFGGVLGRVPLTPVGPMAVTHDGRLFGTCGDGICQLFTYNPTSGRLDRLGAIASVLERRRYGYAFGAAVVGRDGEIVLGEDDNLGHLWLYFPRIERL